MKKRVTKGMSTVAMGCKGSVQNVVNLTVLTFRKRGVRW